MADNAPQKEKAQRGRSRSKSPAKAQAEEANTALVMYQPIAPFFKPEIADYLRKVLAQPS